MAESSTTKFHYESSEIATEADLLLKQHVDADGYVAPYAISEGDIKLLYTRDNISNRRVRKQLEDLFGEEPEIHADTDRLKELIEGFLFTSEGLYNQLREATKHAFLDGHCLIYFNYDNDPDLDREHQGQIRKIPKIGLIYARDVGDPEIDKNISSTHFNEVVLWNALGEKIHYTRVINVLFDSVYGDPKGISILSPEFDFHIMRKSVIKDAIYSYHQNASGIKIFEAPENPSIADVEWLKQNVKKIRGKGEMTAPHGIKVHHPAPKVTDPTPYINPLMEMGCSMPYQILVGTSAGTISGSETNLKNYYKEIHNIRKTLLNQWISEIVSYLQDKGYFPQGEWELDWGEFVETTEVEKSLIEFRKAKVAEVMFNLGIFKEEDVKDYIGITSTGGEVESKGQEGVEEELMDEDRAWGYLSDEDVDKILSQLDIPDPTPLEHRYMGMLKVWESGHTDRWVEELKEIMNIHTERSLLGKIKNLFSSEALPEEEIITAVVKITGLGERELRTILSQMYLTSYLKGYNSIAELHGSPILRELSDYAEIWLQNNSILRSQITSDNLNNRIKHQVIGAIRERKSLGELERIISKEISDYSHNIEALARTELNYAINQGRLDQYERMGVERFTIMAVGDERSCDFCMALDGRIFDLAEARDLLPVHPSCRCVLISTGDYRGVDL